MTKRDCDAAPRCRAEDPTGGPSTFEEGPDRSHRTDSVDPPIGPREVFGLFADASSDADGGSLS
jgi:hypothetical protein